MEKIRMEDIAKLKFLSSPMLSPNGKQLAYLITESDRENNCYKTNINLYDTAAKTARALPHDGKDKSFLWDGDDLLLVRAEYEESDKSEPHNPKTPDYRINLKTGERSKAFDIPREVTHMEKFREGVYAVTAVYDKNAPDPAVTPEDVCREELDYHVIEEAPLWRNGEGFVAGKRNVLYLFSEADASLTAVTSLTTDVKHYQICGSRIAIVGRDWQDLIQDTLCELYLYDADKGSLACIVAPGAGKVGRAAFLGDQLLYTFSDNKAYGNTQLCDFYLYDIASMTSSFLCGHGGLAIGATATTDLCYGSGFTFKTVGDKVFFVALSGFESALYSIDSAGAIEKQAFFEGGSVQFFDAGAESLFVAAAEKDGMTDLYRCSYEGGAVEKIVAPNGVFLSGKRISPIEPCSFVNSAGVPIDGWVIRPLDFDENKRYPALFEIHGGPRAAYGCVMVHEMQMFAGKGYFVFFCNPRGSEGKGEEFADIRGKHGTIDYDDLMEFMDHVLEVFPQIDPKRVAAAGGSYAGFMCNWIEGHTDRFAAIASQRSVGDFVMDFCISDIGFTYDREAAGGDPWNDTEKLWFHSPYRYAPFAKTPILFIHSLCDYDCTIDQGVEMFQAMKYFGVPSRMCLFEGENHELSRSGKPRHRIRRLKEIADWLDRYLLDPAH